MASETASVEHECCPCVQRLRAQNKASSDAWTKRTADLVSDLDGLRHLMQEGLAMHRKGHIGISAYGQAALAEALRLADEAEGKIEALEQQMLRERRARIAAESRLNGPLRPRKMPEPKPEASEPVTGLAVADPPPHSHAYHSDDNRCVVCGVHGAEEGGS